MVNLIGETGQQNAERFVSEVLREAREERFIIFYMIGTHPIRSNWPWMANPHWRAMVQESLEQYGFLSNIRFSPPDSFDSWTFYAHSSAARPATENMALNACIRPGPLAKTHPIWGVFKRHPFLVGSLLALCAMLVIAVVTGVRQ